MPLPITINPLQGRRRFGAFKGGGAAAQFPSPGTAPATGDMLTAARDYRAALMQQQLLELDKARLGLETERVAIDAQHMGLQGALLEARTEREKREMPTAEEMATRDKEAKVKGSPTSMTAMQEGLVGAGKLPGAQAEHTVAAAAGIRAQTANIATDNALRQGELDVHKDTLEMQKQVISEQKARGDMETLMSLQPSQRPGYVAMLQAEAVKGTDLDRALVMVYAKLDPLLPAIPKGGFDPERQHALDAYNEFQQVKDQLSPADQVVAEGYFTGNVYKQLKAWEDAKKDVKPEVIDPITSLPVPNPEFADINDNIKRTLKRLVEVQTKVKTLDKGKKPSGGTKRELTPATRAEAKAAYEAAGRDKVKAEAILNTQGKTGL